MDAALFLRRAVATPTAHRQPLSLLQQPQLCHVTGRIAGSARSRPNAHTSLVAPDLAVKRLRPSRIPGPPGRPPLPGTHHHNHRRASFATACASTHQVRDQGAAITTTHEPSPSEGALRQHEMHQRWHFRKDKSQQPDLRQMRRREEANGDGDHDHGHSHDIPDQQRAAATPASAANAGVGCTGIFTSSTSKSNNSSRAAISGSNNDSHGNTPVNADMFTASIGGEAQLRLRLMRPSDEWTLRNLWLTGWDATISQHAATLWRNLAREVRLVAIVIAATVLCCGACTCAVVLPRQAAATASTAAALSYDRLFVQLPERIFGADVAATVFAAVAALPGWVLALAVAAAALAVAPTLLPSAARMPLLRVFAHHRMIPQIAPDMWAMYDTWSRPDSGREYWVAELQPGGRLVGGVAIKAGAAARPLPPLPLPHDVAGFAERGHGRDSDSRCDGGKEKGQGKEKENEAGFTEVDVREHGELAPTDALLYRMVTDAAVRRRGIGRRLVEVALARAAAAGARRVLLATANADAIAFYRACGFQTRPDTKAYGTTLWCSVGGDGVLAGPDWDDSAIAAAAVVASAASN